MKKQCRETLERAAGIIEGLAWVLEDKGAKDALNCAANMILCVLEAEGLYKEGFCKQSEGEQNEKPLLIRCNEEGMWENYEPYATIDCRNEEDYNFIVRAVEYYNNQSRANENMVEVVRCKDCKYNVSNMERDPLDINDYSGDDIVCSYYMSDGFDPMDFCSNGERVRNT